MISFSHGGQLETSQETPTANFNRVFKTQWDADEDEFTIIQRQISFQMLFVSGEWKMHLTKTFANVKFKTGPTRNCL